MDQTYLDRLIEWIPGPVMRTPIDEDALIETERQLHISLPADFIRLCRHYGSGRFRVPDKFSVEIANPFNEEFLDLQKYLYESFTEYREAGGSEGITVTTFPDQGGLLPFASYNRIHFTWKTVGSPERWPVVVIWDFEVGGYDEYNMGCTELFWKFLRRELPVNPYRWIWAPEDVYFQGGHDPLRE